MNTVISWGEVLISSFQDLWLRFVGIVPNILGAIIVFIIGLFVAEGLGRLVIRASKRLYVDRAIEKTGLKKGLEKVGFKLEISRALGLLVTWFLYLVFLIAAADILNLPQVTEFLKTIVLYIPNVFVAVIILLLGSIIANFTQTVIKEATAAVRLGIADFLATVAKWAILIFAIMAALVQLKVATELIQVLFTGLVAMVALAGGLAFGLGGKDKAAELLKKIDRGKNQGI